MAVIAIIPARGGSKGIPGKNKRLLGGVPLVVRTITAALDTSVVDKIVVTSDDPEILDLSEAAGAEIIRRPDAISGDLESSEAALLHAINALDLGADDIVVFLQCTSPFTTGAQIAAVSKPVLQSEFDSAFSVVSDHSFLWSLNEKREAIGINHNETEPRKRRQDLSPQYRENGAVYVMRVSEFTQTGNRFCGRSTVVPIDSPPLEIDTAEDWRVAEAFIVQNSGPSNQKKAIDFSGIKAVVMDFDGVHTDDTVYVDETGVESVKCSRRDGMGIEQLRRTGLQLFILSKERNPVVAKRAEKLQVEVLHGIDDKAELLDGWLRKKGFLWSELSYIGNDINDLDCIKRAGISFAPGDAHESVRGEVDILLKQGGGKGAIREMADMFFAQLSKK